MLLFIISRIMPAGALIRHISPPSPQDFAHFLPPSFCRHAVFVFAMPACRLYAYAAAAATYRGAEFGRRCRQMRYAGALLYAASARSAERARQRGEFERY